MFVAHTLAMLASYYAPLAQRQALLAALAGLYGSGPQPSSYSPLACECCGTTLGYVAGLGEPVATTTVPMPAQYAGEYVRASRYAGGQLALAYDNPLCAGEVTWWGVGPGGQCGCEWVPCPE